MEEKRTDWTLWLILTVIVSLLLSCFVSALVGGAAGYLAGKKAAPRVESPTPRIERFAPDVVPEEFDVPNIFGAVLVLEVEEGSPADEAGLRPEDIITKINGQPLGSAPLRKRPFGQIIGRYRPGAKITLTVYRGGRERELEITLGKHPESGRDVAWLGIGYRQMAPGEMREWGPRND
ncbi:MAG: S1C family serine protease [Anaerolineales bacterium]